MKGIGLPIAGQTSAATEPTAAPALATPHGPIASLYIHVPFCFHKCGYCDFYSFVDDADRQGAYTTALIRELRLLAPHAGPLRTIFVGGGTPTLLASEHWRSLLGALHDSFDCSGLASVSGNPAPCEFTVECNPETAAPDLLQQLREGGVNRISFGAQSFNPRHLQTLERWHRPESVAAAIATARQAGIARRSIDLIFALPGQILDEWRDDLRQAAALARDPGLDHLSAYSLIFEPNTPLAVRAERGEVSPLDDDAAADMIDLTLNELRSAGLERYEVSNFARSDGARCAHNLAYWRQHQWLAAGPSASAHVAGWRWKNAPSLLKWMNGLESAGGLPPVQDLEPPDAVRDVCERIMLGLRLAEGVDRPDLCARAEALGAGARDRLERAAERLVQRGWLLADVDRWRLSDAGFFFADGAASDLMRAVRSA